MRRSAFLAGTLIFCWLLCGVAGFATRAAAAPAVRINVVPDRPSYLYTRGEYATFRVQVLVDGRPLSNGVVGYQFDNDGYDPTATPVVPMQLDASGRGEVSGTLDEPGFLRCRISYPPGDRSVYDFCAVAYEPQRITPYAEEPADFDAFWREQKRRLAEVPMAPRIEQVASRSRSLSLYKVSLGSVEGTRAYGWLTVPKGKGRYPAMLELGPAGIYSPAPLSLPMHQRALRLTISIHDVDVGLPQDAYDAHYQQIGSYWYTGWTDREQVYFRRALLACVRGIDFLTSRREWDRKHVAVTGMSQGGGLSLLTAGLDGRVTEVAAHIPGFCDHNRTLHNRVPGWPLIHELIKRTTPDDAPAVAAVTPYYDAVNFARRIRGAVLVSAGFRDETCPPSTIFAAYNVIRSRKEIVYAVDQSHEVPTAFRAREVRFFQRNWRRTPSPRGRKN